MSHASHVSKTLGSIPAATFLSTAPLFTLEAGTSLRDALKALSDRGITGAPVFVDDVTGVGATGCQWVGSFFGERILARPAGLGGAPASPPALCTLGLHTSDERMHEQLRRPPEALVVMSDHTRGRVGSSW